MKPDVGVVIAGGGTSGHVIPAIAIAEMLEERGVPTARIHLVGTVRGIDRELLADTEYSHTLLPVTGLKRSLRPSAAVANVRMVAAFVKARRRCIGLLRELDTRVVVSVGGYGSLAPVSAARNLGIPVVVVSYDSRPGLATRRQARNASVVTVADSASPLRDTGLDCEVVVAGAPVRRVLRELDRDAERSDARRRLGVPDDAFLISVVGGSLGSGLLNDVVAGVAAKNVAPEVWWYHVTGPRFADHAVKADRYIAVDYQRDMATVYAASDLLVGRAGASTVAELATVGVPSVLVPWAGAAENHQEHNARQLSDAGAAVLILEKDFSAAVLESAIDGLRKEPARLRAMAVAARTVGSVHRESPLAEVVLSAARSDVERSHFDLGERRRIHIVGIGGPGMSALARALHGAGHVVSGSDIRGGEVIDDLVSAGIEVALGHREALVAGCDAVCASSGVPADNIEMAAARRRGIPALSRADMLAALCACAPTLAVAGTHGKTTTSAMLATMLGGRDGRCGFVVGGDARDLGTNGAWSRSGPFVVEADESDGTHEALPVAMAIVTNVDVDHLDHFGTPDAIAESFLRFARNVSGPTVACLDDPGSRRLVLRLRKEGNRVLAYGTSADADVHVADVVQESDGLTFTVTFARGIDHPLAGSGMIRVRLRAQGRHYALNATAALAVATLNGADLGGCLEVLAGFGGVGRRFDVLGERNGALLIDDYAHLPTEIAALLASAREGVCAGRRVVAVFQPNRFHRMAAMSDEYRDCFADADVVFVTDIYASGTAQIEGVTGRLVVDAVLAAHRGKDVRWVQGRGDLVRAVADELRPGDACLSFGCGDIETFPREVALEIDMRLLVSTLAGSGLPVVEFAPMGERTTYKTGGVARALIEARSVEDLVRVGRAVASVPVPVVVLGRGSNMLVADAGFPGLCIALGDFASFVDVPEVRSGETVTVRIGGATPLPVAARQLSAAGVAGFEWAVGVPGTVGGAIRMNAGGHGSDMVASLVDVDVVDIATGGRARVPAVALGLRFRGSDLGDNHVVVDARLSLRVGSAGCGDDEIVEIVRWRRDNQPGGQNAGSVFVNPDDGARSAGEIIDRLGLSGLRVGGASVSDKHANFIQAEPGATSADVLGVMLAVHRRVLRDEGVSLRSEVRLVGFQDGLPFASPIATGYAPTVNRRARLDEYFRAPGDEPNP